MQKPEDDDWTVTPTQRETYRWTDEKHEGGETGNNRKRGKTARP